MASMRREPDESVLPCGFREDGGQQEVAPFLELLPGGRLITRNK